MTMRMLEKTSSSLHVVMCLWAAGWLSSEGPSTSLEFSAHAACHVMAYADVHVPSICPSSFLGFLGQLHRIQRKPDCKPDDWRDWRVTWWFHPELWESWRTNQSWELRVTKLDSFKKKNRPRPAGQVSSQNPNVSCQTSENCSKSLPASILPTSKSPTNWSFFSLLQSVNESWSMKDMKAEPPAQRGQSQPLTVRSIQNMRIWSILYLFILDLVLWSLHVSIAMNLNAVLHFTPSKMRLKKHVQKYAKLMHSVQEIFVQIHVSKQNVSCASMHFYAFLCIPEA